MHLESVAKSVTVVRAPCACSNGKKTLRLIKMMRVGSGGGGSQAQALAK